MSANDPIVNSELYLWEVFVEGIYNQRLQKICKGGYEQLKY